MTLPAYPAEGQLVAVAGEEIICPQCGAIEGSFTADAYGAKGSLWPVAWCDDRGFPRDATCRFCESATLEACGPDGSSVAELAAGATHFIALHIRSGSWTGWRSIGAE